MANSYTDATSVRKQHLLDYTGIRESLVQCAIEDTPADGVLYSVNSYSRTVLKEFVRLREYCRNHGMPLLTPSEITDFVITHNKTI